MKICVYVILLLSSPLSGGVNKDMSKFFKTLGTATNITEGGAYKDQSAGYYTGGSIYARNTVHDAQLASVRLPGYRAGCGGIDMHLGAFSFISGQEMLQALKAVGSSMASYGLMIALETMSPMVKNIISELQHLAQMVNQSNINSCEVAATALGSVLPKSDAANRHLCTMVGTDKKYGMFSDYASARQGCGSGGRTDEALSRGSEDPRFKKMLGSEFNLAWKAIQENAFLRKDSHLSEFFMSISGTIVSQKKGDDFQVRSKPSLADKQSLLSALLYGGEARVYTCNDSNGDKCLNVESTRLKIKPEDGFVAKVRDILVSIQNKIYEDTPLSDKEKAFLNSTRLPFYKIINVATAYRRGAAPIDITDYAELGAVDVLFQYLSEIIDVINESAAHIKAAQIDDGHISKFQKGLNEARKRVVERRMSTFKQVEQVTSVIRKTELIERMLASKLSAISSDGL